MDITITMQHCYPFQVNSQKYLLVFNSDISLFVGTNNWFGVSENISPLNTIIDEE